MSAVTANIARRVKEDMYYQAQNEAAKQRFIAGGIASWHEHQERKGGNTRQLLQKEIEEEHRAAAIELMLRRRAMIKELYSRESQQYRSELAKKGFVLVNDVRATLHFS